MCSIDPDATTGAELVAGLARLAAELAAQPAPESGAVAYDQVEVLGRAVDLLESVIAARVEVATRTGFVAEWGHTSPTAWLRNTLGMRHVRAEERATLAGQLPRLPRVAKRLAVGDLSVGYAAVIAAGVRRLDEADCGKAEDLLLGFVSDESAVCSVTVTSRIVKAEDGRAHLALAVEGPIHHFESGRPRPCLFGQPGVSPIRTVLSRGGSALRQEGIL